MGFEVRPTEGFTFTKLLDMGLMAHVENCVEIGERAGKEFQIETMLASMKAAWDDIAFDCVPYKSITYIIRGYDDVGAVLDEHIVNT